MTFATVPLTPSAAHATLHRAGGPSAVELRQATAADVDAIHGLIADHVASDHLLPRTWEEIAGRIARFVVGEADGGVVACAELAPLSTAVAEVRSLVVAEHVRGMGVGRLILDALVRHAVSNGHERLCAFTHGPAYFIRLGFSIVPHLWVPEKVFSDCVGCPLFRTCGQHAVVLALDERQVRQTTMRLQSAAEERVA
jgi:N-acetylglutamate synthase-like GNAT family acetyltransferase